MDDLLYPGSKFHDTGLFSGVVVNPVLNG